MAFSYEVLRVFWLRERTRLLGLLSSEFLGNFVCGTWRQCRAPFPTLAPKIRARERTVWRLVHCAFCNPPRFQTLSLASRWSRCRTAKLTTYFRAPLLAAGQNGKRKKKKSQKSGLRPVASAIARDHTRRRKEPRSLITMGGGNVCPPAVCCPLAVPLRPIVSLLSLLYPPCLRRVPASPATEMPKLQIWGVHPTVY